MQIYTVERILLSHSVLQKLRASFWQHVISIKYYHRATYAPRSRKLSDFPSAALCEDSIYDLVIESGTLSEVKQVVG